MAGRPKIIIKESKDNQKYVLLQAANGEILSTSETFRSDAAVNKNVEAIKKVAKTATIVDMTKKKDGK